MMRAALIVMLVSFAGVANAIAQTQLLDDAAIAQLREAGVDTERRGRESMAIPGEAPFDFVLFEELNARAENLWQQIVLEQGSEAAAQKHLFQPQVFDSRLKELHQDFAAFARSSTFFASNFNPNIPQMSRDFSQYLAVPISGLTRVILLNVAMDGMYRLYPKAKGGLFSRRQRKKFEIDVLVGCALNARDRQPKCQDSYSAEDLGLARQLGVAYMFAQQQLDQMCENTINPAWMTMVAENLQINLRWSIVTGSDSVQFRFYSAADNCARRSGSLAQQTAAARPVKRIPEIAQEYLK